MVWNRNWYVMAVPIIMVLSTASKLYTQGLSDVEYSCVTQKVSGYGAVGRYFTPNPYTDISIRWATGMLSVSMITNIIVTFLTAGRIWFNTYLSSRYTSLTISNCYAGHFLEICLFLALATAPSSSSSSLSSRGYSCRSVS